jgi:hypothetical protein
MLVTGILCSGKMLRGDDVLIDPRDVDLSLVKAGRCPILDSHGDVVLGAIREAWVADFDGPLLMINAHIIDNRIGRRAYGMIEREEHSISAGIESRNITIHDTANDDAELSVAEALERGENDPDIFFCIRRSLLVEASLVVLAADPEACVRAADPDSLFRQVSREGEKSSRIDGDGFRRVIMPPSGILWGNPEPHFEMIAQQQNPGVEDVPRLDGQGAHPSSLPIRFSRPTAIGRSRIVRQMLLPVHRSRAAQQNKCDQSQRLARLASHRTK